MYTFVHSFVTIRTKVDTQLPNFVQILTNFVQEMKQNDRKIRKNDKKITTIDTKNGKMTQYLTKLNFLKCSKYKKKDK